jgi:protein-disulfide isomerase
MTTPVNVLQVPVPTRFPAGATPEGDGVEVGSGPVPVDAYVDFQCPFCRQFEEHSAAAINELIANDLITLVYHPLSFLDRLSTTRYSSRATSASGCAADGGRFREYSLALFANQPPEGGPGLSDEQLVEVGRAVGLGNDFAEGVLEHRYIDWGPYNSARAAQRGVTGTPTVYVAGAKVLPDGRAIAAAVVMVLG